jgi:phosphoribosylformimino-5-aminoimidazole carboxamide ribotide isomerase
MQIGGGMNDQNAAFFLEQGASHIIVTSFVFRDGKIQEENLKKIHAVTGKEHLVLDLSCRKKDGEYYIVTDRWQKFTDVKLNYEVLDQLSVWCDEFLIHAVDVEGKASGIEKDLAAMLGNWDGIPVTYAGGVGSFEDLQNLKELGKNKIDVTIGSALDLFGGNMKFEQVLEYCE